MKNYKEYDDNICGFYWVFDPDNMATTIDENISRQLNELQQVVNSILGEENDV